MHEDRRNKQKTILNMERKIHTNDVAIGQQIPEQDMFGSSSNPLTTSVPIVVYKPYEKYFRLVLLHISPDTTHV